MSSQHRSKISLGCFDTYAPPRGWTLYRCRQWYSCCWCSPIRHVSMCCAPMGDIFLVSLLATLGWLMAALPATLVAVLIVPVPCSPCCSIKPSASSSRVLFNKEEHNE